MYFPSSQIETDLVSNGDLAYKSNNVLYYGTYFATSGGKYYANSPNDTVLIELILPELKPDNREYERNFDVDEFADGPDARFESYESEVYSLLTNAPLIPPIIDPPTPYVYIPSDNDKSKGYSIRFFAKKVNKLSYIEISQDTFNKFQDNSPDVAINLYEVQPLIWYLRSPGELSLQESNLSNILNFEKKVNWENFSKYLKITPEKKDFLYTEGGEFLYPNRTNYIGYYHIMDDGSIMTGKEHGDGIEIKLIPFKSSPATLTQDQSTIPASPTPSSTISSGGGSSGGGGY